MWQLLLLLGAGFGIYTLTKEEDEKDGKNKDSKDNTFTFESKEYSDWKEELKDYIDAEGEDYALTEYDWSKVKNKSFQDALKNFKEKKKELEVAAGEGFKMKGESKSPLYSKGSFMSKHCKSSFGSPLNKKSCSKY